MESVMFETYKNTVIPHGYHIHKISADTDMDKMCDFPPDQHMSSHCKDVLSFCDNVQILSHLVKNLIVIVPKRVQNHHSVICMTVVNYNQKKHVCYVPQCQLHKNGNLYSRKYHMLTETPIADFCTHFYIEEKNLEFHLPHVHIMINRRWCYNC